MNKSDFAGWREVFSFTFSQTVKQKAYGIFLVVFSVIALFYSTVSTLIGQYNEHREAKASVGEVVVFDETGLDIDYSNVFTDKKYKNIKITIVSDKTMEAWEEEFIEEADDTLLIRVTFDKKDKKYHVLFVQGTKVKLSELAKVELADEFCDFFEKARMVAVNISEEQRDFIQTDIVREVLSFSENGDVIDKEKEGISYNEYIITLSMLMICMLLINSSGNQIALSIVTEKSSRVLEYLVLNVRPLALIFGKILATIVTSLLQMITVGFCYVASPIVSNIITPRLSKWLFGAVQTAETNAELADEVLAGSVQMIHGIKMEFVILALIFMALGIIFYGIIAGLLGASVSKMDEMQETMMLFQLMLVAGCYADIALCIMQIIGNVNPVISKVFSICPITSPFLVPCNMLLGKMSWPLIFASIFAMLLVIVLLFLLTARVYESMIFYNGKALKIKDIIALASSKKQLTVKEEAQNEK